MKLLDWTFVFEKPKSVHLFRGEHWTGLGLDWMQTMTNLLILAWTWTLKCFKNLRSGPGFDQGRIRPVTGGGAISVIFCSQVSLRAEPYQPHSIPPIRESCCHRCPKFSSVALFCGLSFPNKASTSPN